VFLSLLFYTFISMHIWMEINIRKLSIYYLTLHLSIYYICIYFALLYFSNPHTYLYFYKSWIHVILYETYFLKKIERTFRIFHLKWLKKEISIDFMNWAEKAKKNSQVRCMHVHTLFYFTFTLLLYPKREKKRKDWIISSSLHLSLNGRQYYTYVEQDSV
jgi:hypothetical protein